VKCAIAHFDYFPGAALDELGLGRERRVMMSNAIKCHCE
jgi:hypothetical protein